MPLVQPGLWLATLASLLLAVYCLSMAPGYTFEDTSLFAAACYTLGVAHPPGYPLQVLSCAPFAWLAEWAGWHPAKGAAFASVLAAVGSCVLLAKLAYRLCGSAPAAFAAAAACALTPVFWAQSIIPEAYALNCLLVVAALTMADDYCRQPRQVKLYWLSLLCGLGLSNHWPLFVINLPLLGLWLVPEYRRVIDTLRQVRVLGGCVALFLCGLLPYVLLLRPDADAAVFLGANLPEDFAGYVLREQFSQFDQAVQHPRWDERLRNAGWAVLTVARQYTWVGALLGACGLFLVRNIGIGRLTAVLWGLGGCTFVLALMRPYLVTSAQSVAIFSAYSLTAIAIFGLLLAVLLARAFSSVSLPATMQWLLTVVLVATMLTLNAARSYRGEDDLAMQYASVVKSEINRDALLLVGADSTDFPLTYDRYFDRQAPGYQVENFQNYLDRRGQQPTYDQLPAYLARETQPVFLTMSVPINDARIAYKGAYQIWAGQREDLLLLSEQARRLLRSAAALRDTANNVWSRDFADQMIFEFMLRKGLASLRGEPGIPMEDVQLAQELADTVAGRYALFLQAATGGVGRTAVLEAQLAQLGDLQQYPLRWRVEILYLVATAQLAGGQDEAAIGMLEQALRIYSAAQNSKVLITLLTLHARRGDFQSYALLRSRYPALDARLLAGSDAQCQSNLGRSCT